MSKKGEKENKEMSRRGGDVEMNGKLVRELVEEVRGELERGEVRTVEEALSKRGVSRKLFREMGGIEEWKGERRGRERGGEEREEVEEMGKEELGKFLSRVIRGRELGMGGKEKMSAVGLYMRLKGWDKVKEEREELVGEEMRELLKKDKEKS
nr:MAG: hypothetical protein [Bacteriophage sp.]